MLRSVSSINGTVLNKVVEDGRTQILLLLFLIFCHEALFNTVQTISKIKISLVTIFDKIIFVKKYPLLMFSSVLYIIWLWCIFAAIGDILWFTNCMGSCSNSKTVTFWILITEAFLKFLFWLKYFFIGIKTKLNQFLILKIN